MSIHLFICASTLQTVSAVRRGRLHGTGARRILESTQKATTDRQSFSEEPIPDFLVGASDDFKHKWPGKFHP
ncbi:protein of unknown function (plasmid) [Shinella sp. WSC3-e]|nr:hypothetical protein SHINE37_100358 [Rhizobiaceae bacterium]CAK7261908.1 protein of unknown function [Shinella sp. WSC3-e]